MKKLPTRFMGAALLLVLPLLLLVGVVSAQTIKTGNNATVPSGKVVNSTLFSAGNNVDIAGTVNGDVFCAGQTVTVSGTVNGDVICAGQTVTISGKVNGNVRVAGQSVTISAQVARNATVGAQSFILSDSASVNDLMGAATSCTINGTVQRDYGMASDTATIAGTVERDVNGAVTNLTLTSTAKVGGSITYTSANDADVTKGAVIGGSITRNEPKTQNNAKVNYTVIPYFAAFLWLAYIFVALLIIALVMVLLFPTMFEVTTRHAVNHLGRTLLIGLGAGIVAPALFIALMLTLIGIPLALLFGLVWFLINLVAPIFSAYLLGKSIGRNIKHAVVVMLIGACILLVTYFIPFVGFVTLIVAEWIGIGMILTELGRRVSRPEYSTDVKR